MKKKYSLLLFIIYNFSFIIAIAQGPWTQKSSLTGLPRHRAFTFTLGNKGYLGCGWNGVTMYQDFWEYDPATDSWTQKSNYPAGPRLSAFGFSIGTKGYAGTGLDSNLTAMGDFYQYNPVTNTWTQKAWYSGPPIFGSSCAVVNNMAYICFGDDWWPNYTRYKDLWRYDPLTDSWLQLSPYPGAPRRDAIAFSIGSKAYFGTGNDDFGTETTDFYEYFPANDTWTQKLDFAGTPRSQAVAFAVNGKGYVGTGGQLDVQDFWEYDALSDTWRGIDDFAGTGRENSMSFVIGNRAYVMCGTNGTNYKDLWEFNPANIIGINNLKNNTSFSIFPNPVIDQTTISLTDKTITKNLYWEITDVQGKLLRSEKINNPTFTISRNELSAGIYFFNLRSDGNLAASKKIIIQ